jgi:hypothetical protein
VTVKNVVTKWLLEVLNLPPTTLEIKPRVNQEKPSFPSRNRFYHFWRTPLSQPLLDQSGSVLLYADRDTLSISLELLKLQFPFSTHDLNV